MAVSVLRAVMAMVMVMTMVMTMVMVMIMVVVGGFRVLQSSSESLLHFWFTTQILWNHSCKCVLAKLERLVIYFEAPEKRRNLHA